MCLARYAVPGTKYVRTDCIAVYWHVALSDRVTWFLVHCTSTPNTAVALRVSFTSIELTAVFTESGWSTLEHGSRWRREVSQPNCHYMKQ